MHLQYYIVNKDMNKDFLNISVYITYKQNLVNEQDNHLVFPECFCSIPLSLNIKERSSLRLSLNIISLPETSTILKVMKKSVIILLSFLADFRNDHLWCVFMAAYALLKSHLCFLVTRTHTILFLYHLV